MRGQHAQIDYLDLQLAVSPHQAEAIEKAIAVFDDQQLHIEVTPRLKKSYLLINSSDLVPFLGYLDPGELSEIDLKRLRKECAVKLEAQLNKSLSSSNQAHYKWCLAAIRSKAIGRFLA